MKNYIGFSRDHSGSMANHRRLAVRDYNQTIQALKDEANRHQIDTIVSVIKCGSGRPAQNIWEVLNSGIDRLMPITDAYYDTNGNATPLFDSVGELIAQMKAVPDANDPAVSFVVMVNTDGQDNDSRYWSAQRLSSEIRQLQATDRWTFVFRVPNGYKRGLVQMGIPEGNIVEWDTSSSTGMEKSIQMTTQAIGQFFQAKSRGVNSTDKFYADLSNVSVNEVKQVLVDISKQVTIFPVHANWDGQQIRDFVESKTAKKYQKGTAFYQLTKTEVVQASKQIAIRDKLKGAVYSGINARDMLGLPVNQECKLAPGQHGQFDIFIQSTSVNRKLIDGTNVLVWPGA